MYVDTSIKNEDTWRETLPEAMQSYFGMLRHGNAFILQKEVMAVIKDL